MSRVVTVGDTIEICLGLINDIPPGEGRAYIVNDFTLALFRRRNGGVFALDNRCPHRGGPLADGLMGENEVLCPLHAWRFDLRTGQGLTDPCGVRSYPVRLEHGQVFVTLPLIATEKGDDGPTGASMGEDICLAQRF